ncbi:hypothetical protein D3C76_1171720 [compost metagenome]
MSLDVTAPDTVQRLNSQCCGALDRYRSDARIATGTQNGIAVVTIVLCTAAMFGDTLRRQDANRITFGLQQPGPGLCTWTALHQDGNGRWQLEQKIMESLSGFDAIFIDHPTGSVLAC